MTAPKFMAVISQSNVDPTNFTIPAGHRKLLIWFGDGQSGQLSYDGVALDSPPFGMIAIGDGKEPLDELTFGYSGAEGQKLNVVLQ